MKTFIFEIPIEAPEYTGSGDFPPEVHASGILYKLIQDARCHCFCLAGSFEAKGDKDMAKKLNTRADYWEELYTKTVTKLETK